MSFPRLAVLSLHLIDSVRYAPKLVGPKSSKRPLEIPSRSTQLFAAVKFMPLNLFWDLNSSPNRSSHLWGGGEGGGGGEEGAHFQVQVSCRRENSMMQQFAFGISKKSVHWPRWVDLHHIFMRGKIDELRPMNWKINSISSINFTLSFIGAKQNRKSFLLHCVYFSVFHLR